MTRICLLDSSGDAASLLFAENEAVIAQKTEIITYGHGTILPLMMQELCQQTGWIPSSIDIFGIINGPGGFTGLRAGMAFLAGIACVADKKLIGLDSCRAHFLSAYAAEDKPMAYQTWRIIVNSRRAEKYWQDFSQDGQSESPLSFGRFPFSTESQDRKAGAIDHTENVVYAGHAGKDFTLPPPAKHATHWGRDIDLVACLPFIIDQINLSAHNELADSAVPPIIYSWSD